jgi:hypothetical protein
MAGEILQAAELLGKQTRRVLMRLRPVGVNCKALSRARLMERHAASAWIYMRLGPNKEGQTWIVGA